MIYKLLWGWLRCLRVVILLCSCNMYFHALLFFLFSFSVTLPLLSFSNSVRTVPAHWILSPLVIGAGTLKQTPLFQFPHTLPITAINNAVSLSTPSPTPLHTSHLNATVPFSCIPKGFLWSTGRVFLWVGRKLRLTEVESILPILSTIGRKWKFLNIWMGKETHLGRNEEALLLSLSADSLMIQYGRAQRIIGRSDDLCCHRLSAGMNRHVTATNETMRESCTHIFIYQNFLRCADYQNVHSSKSRTTSINYCASIK